MAKPMSFEDAKSTLDAVKTAMHEQFEPLEKSADRLQQLDHHLSTAAMALEHLFTEQDRRNAERAERIRRAQEE